MPVFAIHLPQQQGNGMVGLLIWHRDTPLNGGLVGINIEWRHHDKMEQEAHLIKADSHDPDMLLEDYVTESVVGAWTKEGTLARGKRYRDTAIRIAVSTILLVNGGNRMLADGSSPIQPDVLTKDLQRFRSGDEETRKRLADRAKRRGKNGWTIGRELQVVVNHHDSYDSGSDTKCGPLEHQHLRRGHFRMQRHGVGRKEARVMGDN